LFSGRSPLQMYHDFMSSFAENLAPWISNGVINQVQVGLGPAGEMRYPSYQLQDSKWTYCGIGAYLFLIIFDLHIFFDF
jgi:beta-amylase